MVGILDAGPVDLGVNELSNLLNPRADKLVDFVVDKIFVKGVDLCSEVAVEMIESGEVLISTGLAVVGCGAVFVAVILPVVFNRQ